MTDEAPRIIIALQGGLLTVVQKPVGVIVEIHDFDAMDPDQDPEDLDTAHLADSPVIQHGFAVPDELEEGNFVDSDDQDDLYEILQAAWERKLDEILGSGE